MESGKWDGIERRRNPYEIAEMVREEQSKCRTVVDAKLEHIVAKLVEMQREIDRWNQAAAVTRTIAIALAGVVAALAAVWEWAREHVR